MFEELTGSLELRIHPNPVLKEVAAPITAAEFGPDLQKFAQQMVAAMKRHNGVGLAGPQVGLLKRIFVMELQRERADPVPLVICNPVLSPYQPIADPQIVWPPEKTYSNEGCLSLPGVQGQVERLKHISVAFQDVLGERHYMAMHDLNARIAQHENDHLDGILFFERMPRNLRKQVERAWEKKQSKVA